MLAPQEWEVLLGMRWPRNACDRSGECCRGAGQLAPWSGILALASSGDMEARAFLSQYVPYPSLELARASAPDALAASLKVIAERGDEPGDLVLYGCRYLKGQSECQIYEDRPQLCRDFPESPFGAIPSCCGYAPAARACHARIADLKAELADLKRQQAEPPPS